MNQREYAMPNWRSFLATAAAASALALVLLAGPNYAQTIPAADAGISVTSPLPANVGEAADTEAVRPFRINFPEAALVDLRRRITATKWPERESVSDATQGVQLATMQKLARYWATDYDWRKIEAKLNSFPQFVTNIDGLDIHFIHIRSKHANALPVIVTHGWPGSVIEQLKIIEPLTNPTAHGGSASDAFDIVIPSMPGYGFSGKPATTGWDAPRIARAWVVLMKRLGYKRFVAQGGDWGALIVDQMGVQAAPELLGIHTNMAGAVPDNIDKAAYAGAPSPSGLSADERQAYDQLAFFYKHGLAYAQEMGNRPQTLYGIEDSPIGLAAWILDHDIRSYELITRIFAEQREGLTRDDILDNITLYWLTNTAVSSARLYWENKLAFFAPKQVAIPVAVSVFPDEIYAAPRSWVEKAYPKLIYYNRLPKGGHFAAWEQPQIFSEEMRAAFRSLRSGETKSASALQQSPMSQSAVAESTSEVCRSSTVIPLIATEPPAKIVIYPPLAKPLASRGVAIIQYCTQNLRLMPVFGPDALAVSPRVGHIHVKVDDALWVWADASGNPIILMGLPPGPHKVLIELEDANHHTLDKGTVTFVVPEKTAD